MLCAMMGVSRAGYYRWRKPWTGEPIQMELRSRIQAIALEFPSYGYRRITRELARRGCTMNHKAVLRLMREDNLLCLRHKSFVRTTDSRHALPVYPNLARKLQLTAVNQLWVADITYIRLRTEFVYLAVILDAFSRRVIGWALGRNLEAELAISALRMALSSRQPARGLIHHSDRGVQYASIDYVALLRAKGIAISMSRTGNPYDNAKVESFMKYRGVNDLYASMVEFIEEVYNRKRLHSALGYLPPAEFEQKVGRLQ